MLQFDNPVAIAKDPVLRAIHNHALYFRGGARCVAFSTVTFVGSPIETTWIYVVSLVVFAAVLEFLSWMNRRHLQFIGK